MLGHYSNLIGPPTALEAKAEQPQDPLSLVQGSQDPSLLVQPQGPLSLEYITLRGMLGNLVDLLAGNAPVRVEAGIMRRMVLWDTACNFNAFISNQSIFNCLITGASTLYLKL